jgi:hypothetical protein
METRFASQSLHAMVSPESKEIVNPEPHIRPLEEERLNNVTLKGSVSRNRATYNIQVGTIEPKSGSKIIDKLRGGELLFRLCMINFEDGSPYPRPSEI